MRKCAYCGKSDSLSKEHLWPDSLLERRQGQTRVYHTKAAPDKFVGPNALQIKDVCTICNSGVLSELDSYFLSLYDEYITQVVQKDETVLFSYDYNLLLRWLLKMLYNNARAVKAGAEYVNRFRRYVDFILNDGKPPSEIFVFLQLIIPETIEGKEVPPSYMECAQFHVPDFDARFADIYVIGIDSFRFLVAALKGKSSIIRKHVIDAFREFPALEGAHRLLQREATKKVRASTITALHAMGPMMMENIELWEERLEGRK